MAIAVQRGLRMLVPGIAAMLFAAAFLFAPARAADLFPAAAPEAVGLSSERLARIGEVLGQGIEKGEIPGFAALVARHGKIAYHEAFGVLDPASGEPMPKDAIFRIYSMTKPITSTAVLILVEEGRLSLADPVSKYLPELANLRVAVNADSAPDASALQYEPATAEIRVIDLMRHTSGLTYGFLGPFMGSGAAVENLYLEGGINDVAMTNAELVTRIAAQPLRYQPQTTWHYSRGTDVLGRLVEVVSGMTLGEFFQSRILGPLGMADSGFYVKADKLNRLAQPFSADREGLILPYIDVSKPPKLEAGGQGLTSTVRDYARFCQMMLNGGTLNGVRIMGSKTAALLHTDTVGDLVDRGRLYLPGPSHGFGLGFAVRTEGGRAPGLLAPMHGSVGEYYWAGYAGTYFWIDPEEDMFAIYMMQSVAQLIPYLDRFKTLVMQAVID